MSAGDRAKRRPGIRLGPAARPEYVRGLIDPGLSGGNAHAPTERAALAPGTAVAVDVVLLALLSGCLVAVLADLSVVRPFLVLAAASVVPGWAVLTCLPPTDLLTTAALSIALSIAVEIGGSLLLGWIGWWQPAVLGFALAGGSALLLVKHLIALSRGSAAVISRNAPCP